MTTNTIAKRASEIVTPELIAEADARPMQTLEIPIGRFGSDRRYEVTAQYCDDGCDTVTVVEKPPYWASKEEIRTYMRAPEIQKCIEMLTLAREVILRLAMRASCPHPHFGEITRDMVPPGMRKEVFGTSTPEEDAEADCPPPEEPQFDESTLREMVEPQYRDSVFGPEKPAA